jgi:RNA polymerase sigma-70 factor (ECF subfamily)
MPHPLAPRTYRSPTVSVGHEARPLNALVERSKRGDTAAFEELTVAYSPDLFRLAAAMVGPDDAADMVQEAFVSAWRELPRLRDADKWESWLRSILMNRCRNALRTRSRRPRLVLLDPDGHAASARMTHEPMRAVDDRWAMRDALAALRPEDRAVIVLHYLADLPLRQVAGVLGLRLGTVKSRLNAGLRALRAGDHQDELA